MRFLSDILAKAGLIVDGAAVFNSSATGQTPASNDNSTKFATTAWVRSFVQPYTLPIASSTVLGGIKVGTGLAIDAITGVLSVSGGSITLKSTQTFTATAGQSIFTIANGYTVGLIDVFLNGVYLSPGQTTATNGSTVTLADPALAGDIIDVIITSPIGEGSIATTDNLPEGTVNLYYTPTRVRTAISLTTTGVSGAATYDNVTGLFNIPNYQGLVPANGLAGQILAKASATSYDTTWIDNYTSQVQHYVKLSVAMTAGTAVYVSGSTGGSGTNMIVSKASNASEGTSSKTLGLLASGGNTNDTVFVITEGLLAGLDTSTAQAGDPVWLGTNGNLIFGLANKPTAPAHLVFIGVVTRVQSNNGEIFVKVQNGFELDELHDLSVKNASDGDMIKYVASTGLWTKIAASTTNIVEGTNLYYTDARVSAYLTANSYATQGYVNTAISNLVASAPTTLDTLNELATALGNDPNFATTIATSIGTKVPQTRTITINGTAYDLSADRAWSIAAGVTSFNTRTGAITLTSGDVTGALGYTPYNSTNPSGYITSSALSSYLPLTGGTMSGVLNGDGSGNFYIYNYGRIGLPNAGRILYNNGTGSNMFFGEIASDVYGFTGNLYSDTPTLAMNVSSRKVTINGSSPTGVLTVQSAADGNMFSIRGFISGYGYPNIVEMGASGADGYLNVKDAAGNIQTSLSGYSGTASYFLTRVLIGTTTYIQGGPYGILTARQTTAGTPGIVTAIDNASSTADGTILIGNLTTASSAYRLISAYSGNGSTDNFSVNQFYIRGDGYSYFKGSVNTAQYRIFPNGAATLYNIVDSDNTYAGIYVMQAGGGSAGYGGSITTYGHSHASRAGYVSAGISSGSGGKFTVMNGGNGSGSDIFTVSSNGNVSVSGLLYADGGINLGSSVVKMRWGGNTTPTLGHNIGGSDTGNSFHIEVSDSDTGGLIIQNDGTTVYGAGDAGFVFRVIDEDSFQGGGSAEDNTCFKVNQGAGGGGYIKGTFTATGDVVAYSDIRVKENISPITSALSKVLSLNGYYYNRTDLKDKSIKVGFIAQEVMKVVPELVTYNPLEDRYAVSYGNSTALLVEAIKEQQAQIDTQSAQITELMEIIKTMKGL